MTGSKPNLLLFPLALLLGATQGREVVLGKAGGEVDLPCKASQKKSMAFTWKDSLGTMILRSHDFPSMTLNLLKGRLAHSPGRKHYESNIPGVRALLLVTSGIPEVSR